MNIVWFRRDLRLHDNPALSAAAEQQRPVAPLFILDDQILSAPDTGPARVAFLLDSLAALDRELRERGSRLIVRRGRPLDVFRALADEYSVDGVFWNRDYTPFSKRRDSAVQQFLEQRGIACRQFKDAVVFEAGEIRTRTGGSYSVFTPYLKTWRAHLDERRGEILAAYRLAALTPPGSHVAGDGLPRAGDLGVSIDQSLPVPVAGEAAGLKLLRTFTQRRIADYEEQRELPAEDGTSRLSAYLRLGCVAPVACVRAALHSLDNLDRRTKGSDAIKRSIETWLGELAWRDFFYQIMDEHPHVLSRDFRNTFDSLEWDNDQELYAAWREGRTGYPIVDAAMRQLGREAWMHNRARMIVATFLVKDLLIDWRWGERFFMRQLVDGDHASNNGGWQWAAGTGSAVQPYFRIFNPISQAKKFDPRGAYVRRYVPELAAVPDRYIHEPWLLPASEARSAKLELGRTYPRPIVDHDERRERALEAYRQARTQ